jgi:hypothetical protein
MSPKDKIQCFISHCRRRSFFTMQDIDTFEFGDVYLQISDNISNPIADILDNHGRIQNEVMRHQL